jgi:hypothetical protein
MDKNESERIAGLEKDVKYIRQIIDDILNSIKDIRDHFIRREEFEPVKKIVYGAAKIALSMVVTGMVLGGMYILVIDKFV